MSLAKETKRCPYCHADLTNPSKSGKHRLAQYNTFRFGFIGGLLFSVMIAILGYLHCNGH